MRRAWTMGASALVLLVLAVAAAWAIEYDDILDLVRKGASDRVIIREIVKDGRAFELTDAELRDLEDAGVSDDVIDAMLDPESFADEYGEDHDDGDRRDGYSSSLDDAYRGGYEDGYDAGRTALVYSFGYYYGPLSRFYYCDPFYYSFYWSGYGCRYWPSYYAFYWNPYHAGYYAYPYAWYPATSYYAADYYVRHTYVRPGYGRTIWDDEARWRDGGDVPPKSEPWPGTKGGIVGGRKSPPPIVTGVLANRTKQGDDRIGGVVGRRLSDGARGARDARVRPPRTSVVRDRIARTDDADRVEIRRGGRADGSSGRGVVRREDGRRIGKPRAEAPRRIVRRDVERRSPERREMTRGPRRDRDDGRVAERFRPRSERRVGPRVERRVERGERRYERRVERGAEHRIGRVEPRIDRRVERGESRYERRIEQPRGRDHGRDDRPRVITSRRERAEERPAPRAVQREEARVHDNGHGNGHRSGRAVERHHGESGGPGRSIMERGERRR